SRRWPAPAGTGVALRQPGTADDPSRRPAVRAPPRDPSPSPAPVPPSPAVLVVDDDAGVRAVLGRLLESEGLGVLLAGSADEAAALLRRHRSAVRLALLDLCLAGPGDPLARQVLGALRELRPALRCCLVSGLVLPGEEGGYLGAGFDAVLRKPFRPGEGVALGGRFPPGPGAEGPGGQGRGGAGA